MSDSLSAERFPPRAGYIWVHDKDAGTLKQYRIVPWMSNGDTLFTAGENPGDAREFHLAGRPRNFGAE